ncbi:hypothetical protein Ae201684P_018482 [Aphanomyces euteiches]|nr:hypothetical protein Ae201684P_018482 [Aphanomyces euteiches]
MPSKDEMRCLANRGRRQVSDLAEMKESLENLVVAAQNISQKAREAQTGASAMLVELATWTDRDEPLPPDTLTAFETWVRTSLTVKNTQATVLWLIEAYRVTQVDSVELPLPQFLSPSRAITMGEATTTNHTETAGVSTAPGGDSAIAM